MPGDPIVPVELYGSDCSYFTGKLENYFHLKGVPYTLHPMLFPEAVRLNKERVGVSQMPVMQLADGRWMTDTTKIIEWFEAELPGKPVVPTDPVQAYICLLLEDYADEWLWRPAMHYRWHYPEGAHLLSRLLANEVADMPVPSACKRWMLRNRQRSGYTTGDGIRPHSVAGVEAIYQRTLAQLQAIFENRPFILGNTPSLADIGFSGPFFRHFGLDPVPLQIMRHTAPAVLEWIARLWNYGPLEKPADWVAGVPEDIGPLLDEVGSDYLPYLCANAEAISAGKKRFDVEVGGVDYRGARSSNYRVWCLQQLRDHFQALPQDAQSSVEALLHQHRCWEPLWRLEALPLQPGQESGLPFRGDNKMTLVNE